MEVKGSQTIRTSSEQVFHALLTPEMLKNTIPGCSSAEYVDFPHGREIKLVVSPNFPGLKGPYTIFIQPTDVVAPSRLVLIAKPKSSLGEVEAHCTIDLIENTIGVTNLNYNAQAEITGKIAATPDFILKGAIKVALDQFFKNFEKQLNTTRAS